MNVKVMRERAQEIAEQTREFWTRADAEGRGLTDSERAEVEANLGAIKNLTKSIDTWNELTKNDGGVRELFVDPSAGLGRGAPGDAFVKSEGYRKISDPAGRASRWSSGPVEVPYQAKAMLLEGSLGSPEAGSALVQPDVQQGIKPTLFERLTVADLIPNTPTTSNKVRVLVESVATNAAGVVAEGGEKPESTLEFDEVDEPVRKIATFLPVSDELLSDAPSIQAYLNSRLSLFVRQREEEQLLYGNGNGNNLEGILARVPAENQFLTSDADGPNSADHVYAAIAAAERSYLMVDTVVVHPDDWADLRLTKDTQENYIAGSPFSNGAPQPGETLWGKRVIVSTSIEPHLTLVGAFGTGAQIFRRGGLTVEASNSHSDYFSKDLVALRAEVRLALAVHRPQAFATADLGLAS